MQHDKNYGHYHFRCFWSKELNGLIKNLRSERGKDYTVQHDLTLQFLNEQ